MVGGDRGSCSREVGGLSTRPEFRVSLYIEYHTTIGGRYEPD